MTHESLEVTIARMEGKIDNLSVAFGDAKKSYVTQDQFKPVRIVVYGMVGIILSAVVTSLVYTVIIKGSYSARASISPANSLTTNINK